jgi:nucleoside-diphosphate-sugar epimerase
VLRGESASAFPRIRVRSHRRERRIIAATFDAAIAAHKRDSSATLRSRHSAISERDHLTTPEGHERQCPPPSSTYGFQKLACEFFTQGAWEQYKLPYTIVRPFNCVGIGERRALGDKEIPSGNVKLAMSHVVPDLVQKVLKGQDPVHILGTGEQTRCYTYGGDLAKGICTAMFHPDARNNDFNISTPVSTTVRELLEIIWRKIRGDESTLRIVSDKPYEFDVQKRIPDTAKARKVLGYEAKTSLETMLDEVIPWIQEEIRLGRI